MAKYLFSCILPLLLFTGNIAAQVQVSANGRFLTTQDGKPFFWLGDTDWELFHRLTREEAEAFLDTRRQQGFNVIQAVALAEFNGLHQPNRYGDLPLLNDDPTTLAITPGNDPANDKEYDYWDHMDYIIDKAAEKGLYIGLLPTWGDKVAHLWGEGPIIFNAQNAGAYARALAQRYASRKNILWILGGDRPAVYQTKKDGVDTAYDDRPIWRAMAQSIEAVCGKQAFITYHPWGNPASSSQYIHNESWLDMNSFQSSHGSRETPAWNWVTRDLALSPQKPTLDMEPCYEDHPVNPWDGKWTRQRGYFTAYDVRARIYRSVFAGACGVTYGHHHVWQFLNTALNPPVNVGDTLIPWKQALHAEAAGEMQFLKALMLSRPYRSRVPDASIIKSDTGKTYVDHLEATRDENGSYAMIYLPQAKPVAVDFSKLSGKQKNFWWFDPRSGKAMATTATGTEKNVFTPPSDGDWVLVIDDASRKFPPPATKNY
jgi:hypothetical protein